MEKPAGSTVRRTRKLFWPIAATVGLFLAVVWVRQPFLDWLAWSAELSRVQAAYVAEHQCVAIERKKGQIRRYRCELPTRRDIPAHDLTLEALRNYEPKTPELKRIKAYGETHGYKSEG